MAKFFRKERAAFIANNNLASYLKYALGEIVLVVIGILIAVGINSKTVEYKNQQREEKILRQLLVEYESNLEEINDKIKMRNLIMGSIEKLIYYADSGITSNDLDSVSFHLLRTNYDPTFDPSNGVTTELLNSGKFYLLQNEELKGHLTSWSGAVAELAEQEELTARFVYEEYMPYLIEHFEHRSILTSKYDSKMQKLYTQGTSKKLNVPRTIKKEVLEAILNDQSIQSYIIFIGRLHGSGNSQSMDTKNKIQRIIDTIKAELGAPRFN
ncbi:MAG: DUF6090 family protein [Salibacteraceae bacterium]